MATDYTVDFYIGHDSRYTRATRVCEESLARHPCIDRARIHRLDLRELQAAGLYTRVHDPRQATEFSFTRFLVPYLNGYKGVAVFCDSDFYWRRHPADMFLWLESQFPVHVVEHDLKPSDLHGSTKMDGKPQAWYPYKNWSSMMMFNCDHADCRNLTPEAVSNQSAEWLHQFQWTDRSRIVPLPNSFNALVGYDGYPQVPDGNPCAVHFTDGGPWLNDAKYQNSDAAREWLDFEQTLTPNV